MHARSGHLAGTRSTFFELDYSPSSIKFNQTALIQYFTNLLSAALHPGFHTRD